MLYIYITLSFTPNKNLTRLEQYNNTHEFKNNNII